MRWLLRKDVLILARSRLLVALLIAYPVAIALLIGFAISRSPSRPRVAIVDETPPGQTVEVGTRRVNVHQYAEQLFSQVQPVNVRTRAQAVAKVRSAQVLAAVVIPPAARPRPGGARTGGRVRRLRRPEPEAEQERALHGWPADPDPQRASARQAHAP